MFDNHAQMKLKLDELQSYLSELPTVEESLKNVQEISFLWPSHREDRNSRVAMIVFNSIQGINNKNEDIGVK